MLVINLLSYNVANGATSFPGPFGGRGNSFPRPPKGQGGLFEHTESALYGGTGGGGGGLGGARGDGGGEGDGGGMVGLSKKAKPTIITFGQDCSYLDKIRDADIPHLLISQYSTFVAVTFS